MNLERAKRTATAKELARRRLLKLKRDRNSLQGEIDSRISLPEGMFSEESSQEMLAEWEALYSPEGNFHLGLREGYERFGPYEATIREIFREEGVPEELAYLAFVESHWQGDNHFEIFRDNATYYGLIVTKHVDERKNPLLAARAVALYLADVYNQTLSWEPPPPKEAYRWGWTILAYNMAPKTAQARYEEYEGDLEKFLAKTENPESKPYLFKFYAMLHASAGFEQEPPLEFDKVEIIYPQKEPLEHTVQEGENPTTLAAEYGCTVNDLLAINDIEDPTTIQIGDLIFIPQEPNYIISYPDILGSLGITENLEFLNPHLSPTILSGEENLPETTIFLPPGYAEKFYTEFEDALADNPEEESTQRSDRLHEVLGI